MLFSARYYTVFLEELKPATFGKNRMFGTGVLELNGIVKHCAGI